MKNPDALSEEIGGQISEPVNPEAQLPEWIKMYEIPGQEEITPHSYLRYLQDKKGDKKIVDAVKNPSSDYKKKIEEAPEDKRYDLIEKGLKSDDIKIQIASAEMVGYVPDEKMDLLMKKVESLIKNGLKSDDIEAQLAYAEIIASAPEDKRASLIEQGLKSGDAKIQEAYADEIWCAAEDKRASLLEQGFASGNVKVQNLCADMLWCAKDDEMGPLKERVFSLIEQGLKSDDVEVQKAYTDMIRYIPEDSLKEKVASLIEQGLKSDDVEVQKTYARMIWCVQQDKKAGIFQIAKEKLGDRLIEPPLYKKGNSSDKFSRTEFAKTGSKTIIIGGELKGKTILRQIEPKAFLAWQELYEAHELWEQEGFDYVPVEPIQAFKLNKRGLVDVYSGVLDLSLGAWREMSESFTAELDNDKKKISEMLDKNGILHGHEHDNNFCLRFFRDANGKADFSRKPRIYLIDFDQAVSPGK